MDRPTRCFESLLRVVSARVTIDLARSMRQNIARRVDAEFCWITEVELDEGVQPRESSIAASLRLRDVSRYLDRYADPTDVELLRMSIQSPATWPEIASRHNLTPNAARQRVTRLRQSLRAWMARHA